MKEKDILKKYFLKAFMDIIAKRFIIGCIEDNNYTSILFNKSLEESEKDKIYGFYIDRDKLMNCAILNKKDRLIIKPCIIYYKEGFLMTNNEKLKNCIVFFTKNKNPKSHLFSLNKNIEIKMI